MDCCEIVFGDGILQTMSVRVLNSDVQDLGEGPHWDAVNGRLLIVDIDQFAVMFIDPVNGDITARHKFDDKVGAVIPYASDSNIMVVAVANRLVKYDSVKREILETLVDVTNHEKNVRTRINDAKCDPYGRILFGTMMYETPEEVYPENIGKLFSYSGNGGLKVLLQDVSLSNGLAWTRDNKTFFYIDSIPNKTLTAYDYSDEGEISNPCVLVDFKTEAWSGMGVPDGMTIDVQDNLWVALFGGNKILNIDSRDGKLLNQVNIPSLNTTSVCFGGADLSTLFVTSAGKHNVPEGLNEPNGGNTFAVTDLGTKGRLAVSFAG
ncbi:regucalcin-like isoform X2 [Varroa destructor]|uniref:SMP-30/Gluconolactonase/LRE-like region domain-containing protein n=1 Tax=Varroa destructor TaxID=109461 RepID=A0A7M7JD36_VARDE|nr:regucalcin-like isoform X2 [Varroa destructor]